MRREKTLRVLLLTCCLSLLTSVASAQALVIPFDNPAQEARLTWMREGAAILLSEMLAVAGEVTIDREERLQAFDRLQLPAGATLSRASTIRVGQALGASLVVSGSVRMQGDQLIARARVVRLDSGKLLPEIESSGPLTDLFAVFGGWRSKCAASRWRRRPRPPIACRPRRRSSSSTSRVSSLKRRRRRLPSWSRR